jgi:tetratricopeptide (TPR) repeat protein
MSSKKSVFTGFIFTVALAVGVAGLYLYRQRQIAYDSLNKLAAAKTLYAAEQWPEAERAFVEIVQKYPKSEAAPESRYYAALLMQNGGKYADALEQWKQLPVTAGSLRATEATYYIGNCQENLGRMQEATASYTKVAAATNSDFASLATCGLGRIAESSGDIEEARSRYEEAMTLAKTKEAQDLSEERLGQLNLRLFIMPTEGPDKKVYLVKRGESLVSIALANNTTVDLISKINGIDNPASLRPGMRLLIPTPEFSIVIDKPDFKLTLYNHDKFFKSYKVGLGKHGCTPVGEFVIKDKIKNPTWWSPNGPVPPGDPHNELGTRWMALKPLTPGIGNDYGIHGTIDPKTIGWESSNGCPRMYPPMAEELYMLVTIGTPVKIQA